MQTNLIKKMSQIKLALTQQHQQSQQINKKLLCDDGLDDLFDAFKTHANKTASLADLYDIDDDFEIDLYSFSFDSNDDAENASPQANLKFVYSFCFKHLAKLPLEALFKKEFFANIHQYLLNNVSKICSRLFSRNSTESEKNELELCLHEYFDCIESMCDYLAKHSFKYEQIDAFVLSILKCIYNYLKGLGPLASSTQNQQEAIKRINNILMKISRFLETKVPDLSETKHEANLIRMCRLGLFIIDFLKESKCVVQLWRIILNIVIKNRLLAGQSKPMEEFDDFIVNNSVSEDNIGEKKTFILNKMFKILHERLTLNLKLIKITLMRLNSVNSNSCFNLSNTQITLTNNVRLDSSKMIKINSFLFKILKSVLAVYFNELESNMGDSFFEMNLNLSALINSLFLIEARIDIVSVRRAQNDPLSDFQVIKQEYVKEFGALFESVVQILEASKSFISYILNRNDYAAKLNELATSSSDTTNSLDDYKQTEHLEELALFYLVIINRPSLKSNEINLTYIFDLLELCSVAINTPSYLLKYDLYMKNRFDYNQYLSYSSNSYDIVEFYDFVLANLIKYLNHVSSLTTTTTANSSNMQPIFKCVYFLSNNLLIRENIGADLNSCRKSKFSCVSFRMHPMRARLSYDLLLYIGIASLNLEYIMYLCELHELGLANSLNEPCLSSDVNIRLLLADIIDYHASSGRNFVSSLEDYLIRNSYFGTYSLIAVHFKENSEKFKINSLAKLSELYTELIELIKQLTKAKTNEQIWIKKLNVFLDTKNAKVLTSVCVNLLEQHKENELKCLCDELLKVLVKFLGLDELDSLFKYFEAFDTNNSCFAQVKQKLISAMDSLKKLYLFVCDSLNVFSLLFSLESSEAMDIAPVLDYMIKHSSFSLKKSDFEEYDLKTLKENSNKILSDVKLQSAHFIRLFASKEIKDEKVFAKVFELFSNLLSDSNVNVKFFSLECLNAFSQTNQTNNRIIRELLKNAEIKEKLSCFIRKVPFDANLDENELLINRCASNIQLLNEYFEHANGKTDKNSNSNEDVIQAENEQACLDDTMGVLMGAMDSTLSNLDSDSNDSKDAEPSAEIESLAKRVEADLDALIDFYINKSSPGWLKEKLANLSQKIQDSI